VIKAEKITTIDCDENCHEKKRLADQEKQIELQKQAELEAEKNRRELEMFEKKFAKKKFKERKKVVIEETKDNSKLIIAISSVLVVTLSIIAYFYFV
jgi:predicted metal-dependent hydrolase